MKWTFRAVVINSSSIRIVADLPGNVSAVYGTVFYNSLSSPPGWKYIPNVSYGKTSKKIHISAELAARGRGFSSELMSEIKRLGAELSKGF